MGSDVVVRGEGRLVESAQQADYFLVTCRDEAGVTQVLAPAAHAGRHPCRHADGRPDPSLRHRHVRRRATLPLDAVVGASGEAAADVDRQFQLSLVMLNAESVGPCRPDST